MRAEAQVRAGQVQVPGRERVHPEALGLRRKGRVSGRLGRAELRVAGMLPERFQVRQRDLHPEAVALRQAPRLQGQERREELHLPTVQQLNHCHTTTTTNHHNHEPRGRGARRQAGRPLAAGE